MLESHNRLKRFVDSHKDLFDISGGASDAAIEKAEFAFGSRFPESFADYLREWGALSIGPIEFYGITSDDFVNSGIPDAIWFSSLKHSQGVLPDGLVVVMNDNGEKFYCASLLPETYGGIVSWNVTDREISALVSHSVQDFMIECLTEFGDMCEIDPSEI